MARPSFEGCKKSKIPHDNLLSVSLKVSLKWWYLNLPDRSVPIKIIKWVKNKPYIRQYFEIWIKLGSTHRQYGKKQILLTIKKIKNIWTKEPEKTFDEWGQKGSKSGPIPWPLDDDDDATGGTGDDDDDNEFLPPKIFHEF